MSFIRKAWKGVGSAWGNTFGLDWLKGGGGGSSYRKGLAGIIGQAREENRLSGDLARDQLRQGLGATLKGYDQAIEKTSGMERTARREAVTGAKDLEASVVNKYGQGGRFGTTALDNARAGLHSSLVRDLESIDANFAGLFAQLSTGRGQAEAGGRGALANLEVGQGAREGELIKLLAGTLKQPESSVLSQLSSLLGAGVGAYTGGQFGGGLGGGIGDVLGAAIDKRND